MTLHDKYSLALLLKLVCMLQEQAFFCISQAEYMSRSSGLALPVN